MAGFWRTRGSPTITGRRIDIAGRMAGVLAGGLRPPARTYASRGLRALASLSLARSDGRTETRRIWCSTALNTDLDFPYVSQAFLIEREVIYKKSRKVSTELALGITSRSPDQASPERLLELNRGHWTIENRCHYVIDWNFDEDRSRIRTGHGPENVSRLRRFAVGVIQFLSDDKSSVAQKMQQLNRNTRLVFDYLRMSINSTRPRLL